VIPLRDVIPSRTVPYLTVTLIALNVVGWFFELTLPARDLAVFLQTFGVVPAHFQPASLLTSMFLHGSWSHVLGNMLYLWIFGDNVEDRMGPARFLVFYLLCGVLAGAAHVAFNAGSAIPTIGASGAIAGVMGAYLVLFPGARVITLVPVFFYPLFVELPAFVFLLLWFVGQVLSSTLAFVAPEEAGGIAFLAHVGGFVAGVLLHWLFLRPARR
jgi:membrane associated rhomboid family serine protease